MAIKKANAQTVAEAKTSSNPGLTRWGGNTRAIHVPSGKKLILGEDEDCILVFIGQKDISEKCDKEPGEVVYNIFTDGKRMVSMPCSYAFTEFRMEPERFYYIHVAALIPNRNDSFNDMKDFEVVELGVEGDVVKADPNRTGAEEITLTLPVIAELNYNKMNYPFRK
jgi:hypothetical protein